MKTRITSKTEHNSVVLLLFYFCSKQLRAEKLFITLQIRRKYLMILSLCDCKTYILTGGGASLPLNVP